jgi:hypothetical protein
MYTFAPGPPRAGEQPVSFSQTFGTQNLAYGQTEFNAFVSDEIRVACGVTATIGLRYEYQSITNSRKNLGPRLGLAWDVGGSGRTIVRAGGGIFYDQQFLYVTRRFYTSGANAPTQSFTIPYGAAGFPTFPNSLGGCDTTVCRLFRCAGSRCRRHRKQRFEYLRLAGFRREKNAWGLTSS